MLIKNLFHHFIKFISSNDEDEINFKTMRHHIEMKIRNSLSLIKYDKSNQRLAICNYLF